MTVKTTKIHLILSFFFWFLATQQIGARKELHKVPAPSSPIDDDSDYPYYPLAIIILAYGITFVLILISLVLFKQKFISSHGLILVFGMVTWTCSVAVQTDTGMFIMIQGLVNLLGLACWIYFGVREFKKKNAWPSADLLFETGSWFYTVILSSIEYQLLGWLRLFYKIAYWYPAAMAFLLVVEHYWTKGRKLRERRLKSQLIKDVEDAFDDFLRSCLEKPRGGDTVVEFDQKVKDFNGIFSSLVDHRREALKQPSGGAQGVPAGVDQWT